MTRFPSVGLEVQLVTDPQHFLAMRAEWNLLSGASQSVFLTHEWFEAAWRWRAGDSSLAVIAVTRDGALIGALPLVSKLVSSRSGSRRAFEALTVPDTQAFDVLAVPAERTAVVRAIVQWLGAGAAKWDVLEIGYLPVGSVAEDYLAEVLRAQGYSVGIEAAGSNPYIDLSTGWDAYYSTRTRSLKKANNLAANRLRKSGEVKVRHHTKSAESPADRAERLVALFAEISSRSWKRETGNSLDHPGPNAFIRRLTELSVERGWLSAWTLDLDEKALATEYQLVFDGSVHALRSDFDSAFSDVSPGSHLFRVLLEELFQAGLRRYYMGPGENAYKLRWTEKAEPLRRMRAYSRSPSGRLAALIDLRVLPLARALRDRLSPKNLAESMPDATLEK
jgi:CelD/BcsL family acetyltransferase involved in cellulose biosynthesis